MFMIKNAYEYLFSKGYHLDFGMVDYNNVCVSYDNKLEWKIREDLVYYGRDKQCRLYFKTDSSGHLIFNDYAICGEDFFEVDQDYIICSLFDCLKVSVLQNDLFDRSLEEMGWDDDPAKWRIVYDRGK